MTPIENTEEEIRKVKLGITMGDFNGIGLEVVFKTFSDPKILESCTPVIYGSSKVASYHRKMLNLNELNFNTVRSADEASHKKVNIVHHFDQDVKIDMGHSTQIAGEFALSSVNAAIQDLKDGKIEALVTAPVNKYNIQSETFKFAGHTDYLAQRFDTRNYLMLLISHNLKVGVVTAHIPISQVAASLTTDLIYNKIRVLHNTLKSDFTYSRPRIAVLGLNPHAGDNGLIGKEELEIIIPAIQQAFDEKILVFGPYPSDGFFGNSEYLKFDAILAMYHDQGLVPFKTLAFDTGVNYTAGLPIVRTSPDHGTGYDIAGKDLASPNSFRQAVYLACDIVRNRAVHDMYASNPLKTYESERSHSGPDITITSDTKLSED
ncbi:MAG: 4-hydroxythreonine-4-phosphate dehydrogenase PdxA [Bacteroidetes bacterium]|nr:4-hydroxythreonine-4-phosphate dehydrogenase PdxA [Bacteroidota bacterium]